MCQLDPSPEEDEQLGEAGSGSGSDEQRTGKLCQHRYTDLLLSSAPLLTTVPVACHGKFKDALDQTEGFASFVLCQRSRLGKENLVAGVAGALQQQLVGLHKEDREVEPHRNPKLATWKEDLAAHTEKLEEAKKVESLPMLHCHTGRHTKTISL